MASWMVEVFPAIVAGTTNQTPQGERSREDSMSDELRPEGVEHDPVAAQKDHDTVAQQQAEKEEKEKHPSPPITPRPTKNWHRRAAILQRGGASASTEERGISAPALPLLVHIHPTA